MSDVILVRNDGLIEYIAPTAEEVPTLTEEAAGKGLKMVVGIVAAIAVPFAAPFLASAIGLSAGIGGILGSVGFGAAATAWGSALGSAVVGGALNAATQYALGARGADVWKAAGIGALSSGFTGYGYHPASAPGLNTSTAPAPTPGTGPAPVNPAPPPSGPLDSAILNSTGPITGGSPSTASSVASAIGRAITDPATAQRVLSAVTMAASSGQQLKGMENLVAARQAELQAMDAQTRGQVLSIAQQQLQQANAIDPNWLAKVAATNTAISMNASFTQAERTQQAQNPQSSGARAVGERQAKLAEGRAKAGAWNSAYLQGLGAKQTALGNAAGTFGAAGNMGTQYFNDQTNLDTALQAAKANNRNTLTQVAGLILSPSQTYPKLPNTDQTAT